jgi:hypothetical protein
MPIRRSPNGAGHTRPQPGRDRPEWVVAINRNAWSQSIGIGGRNQPVRARYDALVRTLTEIGSFNEETINESDDFHFQSFSDSVIMSTATTHTGLLHLLHLISNLSLRLLSNGLLMRGAIAKGKLHHDQFVMFGSVFLVAYNIETTIAKYPRVLLSREVYQDFRRLAPSLTFPRLLLADDGPPYLHVLAGFKMLNEAPATPDYLNSEEVRFAQTCQCAIQNLLDTPFTSQATTRNFVGSRSIGIIPS